MSILNPLYFAVAWVLQQINHGLTFIGLPPAGGLTWVLSIVILVVLMRLILVPLFVKQMHATRKMAALAPQLQELRKRYKNDKETLNAETMRLYRENGANPLAGCLPLVAQMPIFFALFNVLRAISEWVPGKPAPYGLSSATVSNAKNADILGAHLSDKVLFTGTLHVPLEAKIVIICAVAISVATTFMTVRQNTKRGLTPQMTPDNPMASSQKIMQYVVPLFALSGLYWQFGLVLYWVTTNVWTLGQQWVLFKRYPMPTPVGAAAGSATAAAGVNAAPPGKPSRGGGGQKPPSAGGRAGGQGGKASSQTAGKGQAAANGAGAKPGGESSANGSGMLRRLGRGRSEGEPQPAQTEVKLVRQQRVRQPRSKRSGKR